MDQVTQQNAAMVEETTAASHNLTREALQLGQLVRRFRTAKGAPESWAAYPKHRLYHEALAAILLALVMQSGKELTPPAFTVRGKFPSVGSA